jgi:PAS domain S-box-containing protein
MAAPGPNALAADPGLLRAALDASRVLMLVVDRAGLVRGFNRAVERVSGIGKTAAPTPLWTLAALPNESALLEAAFKDGTPERLPPALLFHLKNDGAPARVVDWDVSVLRPEGEDPAIVLTGFDVSERLAAERQLRDTDTIQRMVLDRLPAIVWATDKELRFTFSAGGGLGTLRLDPDQVSILGTSLYSYFHTGDPSSPGIAATLRALHGESVTFEMTWFDRLFQTRVEPFRDREENIVGAIGVSFDVTDQARTARALRESETHLRRLIDANVMGIFFWDETGLVTDANDAFLQLIGASREELRAGTISWIARTPPELRPRDERAMAELLATGRISPFEKVYIANDGTRVPVLLGAATFDLPPKRPLTGAAFVFDLREQVRLRQTRDQLLLKEQKARIETEVANARLLLLVEGSRRLSQTRHAGETLDTLAALAVPALADWSYVIHRGWGQGPTMVAWAHGDPNKLALLRKLKDCLPDPTAPEGAPRVFRTGEVARYEDVRDEQLLPDSSGWTIVGMRDPEVLHAVRELGVRSMLCVPIEGRSGVDGVLMLFSTSDPHRYGPEDVVLAEDLAGRAAVSLENGRLLFEALDAVRARDDFLAVAAHELRTPLTSLLLQTQLLDRAITRGLPDAALARRNVSVIEAQARRLSTLLDGLLDVTRLASKRLWLRTEELDLHELLESVLRAMNPELQRSGCAVAVTTPERVMGRWDRLRVEQVLTNLLTNAMKFGAGHPIEVSVQETAAQAIIAVRDHGMGISKVDQARIFERFERAVSTRHFGGLGLGLYISAQIVRAHHGSLRVDSEPGQGAVFTVTLPRALERPLGAADAAAP